MADIFISYARADRERVEKLAAALEAQGYAVWWDRQIVGGADFTEEIEKELGDAKAVIVAWSAEAAKSAWVKDEAVAARDAGKLIPITFDETPAPMGFRQFQWIDCKDWKGGALAPEFQDLARAVKVRLTGEAQPTPTARPKVSLLDRLQKPSSLAAMGVAAIAVIGAVLLMDLDQSFFKTAENSESSESDSLTTTMGRPIEGQLNGSQPTQQAQAPDEKSIAVLPFIDLSEAGDQEYFSDGISEEILNVLVRIPDLKVTGRTSSFAFKDRAEDLRAIGSALKVSYILDGSVRRSGTKLRITAQLIQSDDGFQLWSETFDRELMDIFDIQDEIAQAVSDQLAVSLGLGDATLATNRTGDIIAYEKYLRAKQLFLKRGADNLELSAQMLSEVVSRDPDFASAWSLIAGVYAVYEWYHRAPSSEQLQQWRANAKAAAKRAIMLNPKNGGAIVALGVNQTLDYEWVHAFDAFDQALLLAPTDPYALDQIAQAMLDAGYFEQANETARRAISADPLAVVPRVTLGRSYFHLEQWDKGIEQFEKAIQLNPSYRFPYHNLWDYYLNHNQLDEADAIAGQAVSAGAETTEGLEHLIAINNAIGDKDALEMLRGSRSQDRNSTYLRVDRAIARLMADQDAWIADAEKLWVGGQRSGAMVFMPRDYYRDIYHNPRWKKRVREVGMLDLWRSRGFPAHCRPVGDDDFECD